MTVKIFAAQSFLNDNAPRHGGTRGEAIIRRGFASSGVVPRRRIGERRNPFNKESDSKIQMLLKRPNPSDCEGDGPQRCEA